MSEKRGIGLRRRAASVPSNQVPRLAGILSRPLTLFEFEREACGHPEYYVDLQALWQAGELELLDDVDSPRFIGSASSPGLFLDLSELPRASAWKLSRFALMRRSDTEPDLVLESARTPGKVSLSDQTAVLVCRQLAQAASIDELDEAVPGLDGRAAAVLFVLRATGMITRSSEDGDEEQRDECLAQWEFHDMLFHTHSRMGRTAQRMGATYRFRGRIDPQPAVKPNPWSDKSIHLTRPDLHALALRDPSLTQILEGRRSVRVGATRKPIALEQIAEFLFRAARVRSMTRNDFGEFTSRPYPNGGASYELELYLAVNMCDGLERGMYYYDPSNHALSQVSAPTAELDEMFTDAWRSAAEQYVPQVLIVIASRFQRVAWKYSGMAYATQLKNAGALIQTMYLVATAMGLAPCALGLGDAERFCRITQTDYLREGSIGEFLLGAS